MVHDRLTTVRQVVIRPIGTTVAPLLPVFASVRVIVIVVSAAVVVRVALIVLIVLIPVLVRAVVGRLHGTR